MSLNYQDVATDDALRKIVIHLSDIGTATAATNQDVRILRGLNGSGGTITGIFAKAGTAPAGTITALVYDINTNGTTVFTGTQLTFTTAVDNTSSTAFTAAGAKVYNGDLFTLDCVSIGNSTAGANVGVAIEIRVDEPND